jgi:hypothetical protein
MHPPAFWPGPVRPFGSFSRLAVSARRSSTGVESSEDALRAQEIVTPPKVCLTRHSGDEGSYARGRRNDSGPFRTFSSNSDHLYCPDSDPRTEESQSSGKIAQCPMRSSHLFVSFRTLIRTPQNGSIATPTGLPSRPLQYFTL